ncbi:hypothetical protein Drorol1_Dr00005299, partial [Drosera rotundifolia]
MRPLPLNDSVTVKGKRFRDGEGRDLQLAAEIEEKGKELSDGCVLKDLVVAFTFPFVAGSRCHRRLCCRGSRAVPVAESPGARRRLRQKKMRRRRKEKGKGKRRGRLLLEF